MSAARGTLAAEAAARPLFDGLAATGRLSWPAMAGIALFAAAVYLPFLGSGRALTYHEIVFAEPAREMLATGDYLVPRVAGVPFTDKPPATAWAIAATMAATGSRAEWACRLPSVLAAVVAALALGQLSARWLGSRVGLVTALAYLTSVSTATQARLAESDLLLAATVSVAYAAFAFAELPSPDGTLSGRRASLLYFAALGASFLVKGLVGPVFIVSGTGLYLLLERRLAAWRFFADPAGWGVVLGLTVPWMAAAYVAYPPIVDNMLLHHVGRFQGELGLHEPWYAYLYLVPMALLPWAPLAVVGAVRGARVGLHHHPFWQLLACWFVPGMTLLCLSTFKARHYPLPLFPPLVILAAAGLVDQIRRRHLMTRQPALLMGGLVVVGTVGALWALAERDHADAWAVRGIVILIGVGALAAVVCEARRWLVAEYALLFGTAAAAIIAVQALVVPWHDSYGHQKTLAQRINARLPADATVHLVRLPDNQVTYYLAQRLARFDKPEEFLASAAARAPAVYVLAPRAEAERLAGLGRVEWLDRADALNDYMTEADRLSLVRWEPATTAQAPGAERH